MDQPMVTRAGEALSFTTTPTDTLAFLCQGDSEMPDVMSERLSPGDGPPLHSHPWANWEVVVRGRLRVRMGEDTFEVSAGDFFHTPSDVVHTFMAIGDEPAEIVAFGWPGGFHKAYAEISKEFADGEPDFGALAEVAGRHHITLHGPPLAVLEAAGPEPT